MHWFTSVLVLKFAVLLILAEERKHSSNVVYLIGSLENGIESKKKGHDNVIPNSNEDSPPPESGVILDNPIPEDDALADGVYFRPENGKPFAEHTELIFHLPKVRKRRYATKSGSVGYGGGIGYGSGEGDGARWEKGNSFGHGRRESTFNFDGNSKENDKTDISSQVDDLACLSGSCNIDLSPQNKHTGIKVDNHGHKNGQIAGDAVLQNDQHLQTSVLITDEDDSEPKHTFSGNVNVKHRTDDHNHRSNIYPYVDSEIKVPQAHGSELDHTDKFDRKITLGEDKKIDSGYHRVEKCIGLQCNSPPDINIKLVPIPFPPHEPLHKTGNGFGRAISVSWETNRDKLGTDSEHYKGQGDSYYRTGFILDHARGVFGNSHGSQEKAYDKDFHVQGNGCFGTTCTNDELGIHHYPNVEPNHYRDTATDILFGVQEGHKHKSTHESGHRQADGFGVDYENGSGGGYGGRFNGRFRGDFENVDVSSHNHKGSYSRK